LRNKTKIDTLRFMVRKLKAEKVAMFKEWQEFADGIENIGKDLKLDIENGEKKLKEEVTRHNSIIEKLKENVECPVCMEIPRSGPIFLCPNGHFVCKKCKTGSCPTCRIDMGIGKSLLAITVIENIDHKCKFVECEELFAVDKLEAHEENCRHRLVKCPYYWCNEEIALSNLLAHLGKKDCSFDSVPTVIETSSKTGKAFLKVNELSNLTAPELCWKVYIYSYRDTNFAIKAKKQGDYYHFTMVMFEAREVCSNFQIEMEVRERDPSPKDSKLSIRFQGNPCSVEENKEDVKFLGLTVHHKVMEQMMMRNADRLFTVSFKFSEKRAMEPEGLD